MRSRGTGAVVVRDAVAMTLSGVNEANVGEVAELGLGAAQNAARAALSRRRCAKKENKIPKKAGGRVMEGSGEVEISHTRSGTVGLRGRAQAIQVQSGR